MSDARERMMAYLAAHNTLTLATERNGTPFACSLFYVNDGLVLYFVSDSKTRHAENIAYNAHVGVTVHEDYRDWRTIQGIQLQGNCILVSETAESNEALELYSQKFPFVVSLGTAMSKVKFYKITPDWTRFIDNTKGFGFKEELELS